MCLAIPAKVVSITGTSALIDLEGNGLYVDISLIDDIHVGDYVIAHAGIAIQKYSHTEAQETIHLLNQLMKEP